MESNKPKILIFTDWYLPGYKAGGPIKSCANLVAQLHNDFQFFIICSDRDYLETQPYTEITRGQWNSVGKAQVMYLAPEQEKFSHIRRIIRSITPDKIYINGIFSRVYSIYSLFAARRLKSPLIVAPRGMLAPGAMALKRGKKRIFLTAIKVIGGYRNILFHATDEAEAAHIRENIGHNTAIQVIPNIPGLSTAAEKKISPKPSKRKNVLNSITVARIAPEKNIDFAVKCFMDIPPHVTVNHRFIGPVYDEKYLATCRRLAAGLPQHVTVEFIASTPPAGIAKELEVADLFFLPTLGENYGHAIIEALMANVPVLISNRTPWRELSDKKLGMDADLKDKRIFVDYLTEIAETDKVEYEGKYGQTSQRARLLVDIPHIAQRYKSMLA